MICLGTMFSLHTLAILITWRNYVQLKIWIPSLGTMVSSKGTAQLPFWPPTTTHFWLIQWHRAWVIPTPVGLKHWSEASWYQHFQIAQLLHDWNFGIRNWDMLHVCLSSNCRWVRVDELRGCWLQEEAFPKDSCLKWICWGVFGCNELLDISE